MIYLLKRNVNTKLKVLVDNAVIFLLVKKVQKVKRKGDLKEFWHFGQYVEDDEERRKEYPENVEVKELPGFNKIGKTNLC